MTTLVNMSGFTALGVAEKILKMLQRLNISIPTPIQKDAIPVGLAGKDVLGIAQTGTGKTLAFGIPVIQRLESIPGRALVVVPTRELALQVHSALVPILRAFSLHSAVLIGGVSQHGQVRDLSRRPRVVIATPGRLLDLMEQEIIGVDKVGFLVLDEADRMLDMGFAPQINRILKALPRVRQTFLFSATMPQPILKLAHACMTDPVRVEVSPPGTAAVDIEQEIFITRREVKLQLLGKLLQDNTGTMLVFSRTKHGAKKITRQLKTMGHGVAEIHSNRSQSQRQEALMGFKSGKYRVLVATDIAARGIDVVGIGAVVNFDLPANPEDYVHRIGRTGRAGKKGRAVSFVMPDQRDEVRSIERLIRKTLTIARMPALPVEHYAPPHVSLGVCSTATASHPIVGQVKTASLSRFVVDARSYL